MTNLVICCDGTWNTPDQNDKGVPAPTNVARLYNCVDERAGQKRYYHPGVGTDGSWWDKAIGGGTGAGLDGNVMSAYRWLCEHYESDADNIYLFGFSRGAYTVRSLIGFINCCGLLRARGVAASDLWPRIERLFQNGYRTKTETRDTWRNEGWAFHDDGGEVPIRFLGVWDTVGALGIPDTLPVLRLLENVHDYRFHDTLLSDNVKSARHAVSMDEMRESFQPTLWTNAARHADAQECWFPGVHSDVGGGYHEAGLANGALRWMIAEARNAGLVFSDAMVEQVAPNYLDMVHDSCTPPFSAFPTQPRSVPALDRTPYTESEGAEQASTVFHVSVKRRQNNPPIEQCPYRQPHVTPDATGQTVEVFARQQWNPTGIWLEADTSYTFAASGEWVDSTIKSGPEGTDGGHFFGARIVYGLGGLLGLAEGVIHKVTGNTAADVPGSRRHEDMPWFCLVGAVANGGGADSTGRIQPHEAFMIRAGCIFTPQRSGYLYAYANDAWHFYGNNKGKVDLHIALTRTSH
jgi:hypothetical protein